MTNSEVSIGNKPYGKATRLHLSTNVRPRRNNYKELELDAEVEKINDIAITSKIVHALARTMVAPMNVKADGIESHALYVCENSTPSSMVGNAKVMEFCRDDGYRFAVK